MSVEASGMDSNLPQIIFQVRKDSKPHLSTVSPVFSCSFGVERRD